MFSSNTTSEILPFNLDPLLGGDGATPTFRRGLENLVTCPIITVWKSLPSDRGLYYHPKIQSVIETGNCFAGVLIESCGSVLEKASGTSLPQLSAHSPCTMRRKDHLSRKAKALKKAPTYKVAERRLLFLYWSFLWFLSILGSPASVQEKEGK